MSEPTTEAPLPWETETDRLRGEFDNRATRLINDVAGYSGTSQITTHPLFGELISMGTTAAQHALERLAAGDIRILWFILLKRITGADPVPVEHRGMLRDMANHWIAWGKEQRLIDPGTPPVGKNEPFPVEIASFVERFGTLLRVLIEYVGSNRRDEHCRWLLKQRLTQMKLAIEDMLAKMDDVP